MAWGPFLSHVVRNGKGSAGLVRLLPTLLSGGNAADGRQVCVWQSSDLQSAGLGVALGLQAACSGLEQQLSNLLVSGPQRAFVTSIGFYCICN